MSCRPGFYVVLPLVHHVALPLWVVSGRQLRSCAAAIEAAVEAAVVAAGGAAAAVADGVLRAAAVGAVAVSIAVVCLPPPPAAAEVRLLLLSLSLLLLLCLAAWDMGVKDGISEENTIPADLFRVR